MAEPNANPAVEPNGLKFTTRDLPTLQAVQDLQESDALPAPLPHRVLQFSTRAGEQRRAGTSVGILTYDQVTGTARQSLPLPYIIVGWTNLSNAISTSVGNGAARFERHAATAECGFYNQQHPA